MALDLAGRPGIGGVTRGRADAEMIWGEESAGRSELFRPETLPDARYLDVERSQLVGVGVAAPEARPEAEAAGLSEVGTSAGETAWRRRLSPRHRQAVGAFFSSTRDGGQKQ